MINNNKNCINIKNSQIGINIEDNTFENNIETPILIQTQPHQNYNELSNTR